MKILKLFRDYPQKEFSTKEIVEKVFFDGKNHYDFGDREVRSKHTMQKSRLHRNILYHLNKLCDEEILTVGRVGQKGRKYFVLNLGDGEEIVFKRKRKRLFISKPPARAMPIEGYEHKNILFKFDPETWISRVNSLLIQSEKFKINELFTTILDCFSNVNDVICLNDFEKLIDFSEERELNAFIKDIANECEDYGRQITIIIDIKNMKDEKKLLRFLEAYKTLGTDRIVFIFEVRTKDIQNHWSFFEKLVQLYNNMKRAIPIKNKDLHQPPHILGRAGPYTFEASDWEKYCKNYIHNTSGVVCGFCSIAIDVKRFFSKVRNMDEFRKLIHNTLKSLFLANSAQRTHSEEYFKNILKLNTSTPNEFFQLGRNYIRFWNYGWKQPDLDQQLVVNLIKSTKKEVQDFCFTQEAIYKACGMPTQFKVAFSCAFKEFSTEEFSKKDFKRTSISSIEELYSGNIKEIMDNKEKIGQTFDGGDRATFARSPFGTPSEIVRELDLIVNLYKIPLFYYDLSGGRRGDLSLKHFFENE
ncbi:MAG: hypothetical protein ACOCZ6_01365 [Nanoarchaeota archaeon]